MDTGFLLRPGGTSGMDREVFFVAVTAAILLGAASGASAREAPWVEFDVSCLVGCRDVTPAEFSKLNPDEKLVEAKFQVSSLIRRGREEDLVECLYHIENSEQSFQVVDYLPKTTLASEIAGNMEIQRQREKTTSIGISVNGRYDHLINGTATGGGGSKQTSSVRYELLPPMALVAAAGTTGRGTGVYFKLRPSKQTSLEGAKDFAMVMRVPETWRGDCVRIHCRATGLERDLVRPSGVRVAGGSAVFVVALYVTGDKEAKATAARLVRAERTLRTAAAAHRREIKSGAYPTVAYRLGAALDVVQPRIPCGWLDRFVRCPDDGRIEPFRRYLPAEVRQAAEQYAEARLRLHKLNGTVGPAEGS